jgi:peptidoglycan-associated lipoprotein
LGKVSGGFAKHFVTMKTSSLIRVLFVGAALTLGMAGCVHGPASVTPIPNPYKPPAPPPITENNLGPGAALPEPSPIKETREGLPADTNGPWAPVIANHNEDAATLKPDTVYFDLDSATIKKTEYKKLEEVANFLTNHLADALRVEGNCDERGTEKYNLSLGEKRALAVREYLANLGVDARQIVTVSYGKARPAAPGHDEAAWSKNRRDDFVLLTPKAP